jgi:primosomal protein N' (replication factor Y)
LKISVALAYNLAEPLTYRAPREAGLQPGSRVLVPLGRRVVLGWVMGLDSPYSGRLKDIVGVIDDPFIPAAGLLEFARLAAAAYFASAGILLDHCLPPSQKNPKNLRLAGENGERKLAELAGGEAERLSASGPLRFFFKKPTEAAPFAPAPALPEAPARRWLLGPGREQEYRDACAQALAQGRSVILVVPDNASARYWQSVIPGLDPYHSEIGTAERERTWRRYRQGKCGIVCGGIAALGLPLAAPGLLIVDRASSPLYRHAPGTPFHLDHLAGLRAQAGGIPLLAGAHSHTCASFAGGSDAVLDDRRPSRRPAVEIHPLKGRERGIPAALIEQVRLNFLAGRKTLVLVNRIQPARYLYCEACGRLAACPRCGASLQADKDESVACRRCAYRHDAPAGCPRCGKPLAPLHDISIDSLSRAIERVSGETAVLALTAAELKDPQAALAAAKESPVVIATMAALNPVFQGLFAAAIWVKPESFFSMEDYDAAEMIHAVGAEIAATLAAGGELHVFSVFHFHHALQYLLDEEPFFERELKYRRWFLLPPFAAMYELELRDGELRSLGAAMRALYARHRDRLRVQRVYLASRQPQRGTYRGILELHADPGPIAAAGLHRIRRSVLRRTAG